MVATVAPVIVSAILFAVTGSPFMLLMAALGPVIAVATFLDGRRQRRRAARAASTRFESEFAEASRRVEAALVAERARRAGFAAFDAAWSPGAPVVLAVGRGDAPTGIEMTGAAAAESPALDALRVRAATLPAAPLVQALGPGFVIGGPPVVAAAAARTFALRIAARLSPASTVCEAPAEEAWARALPHAVVEGASHRYRFVTGESVAVIAWETAATTGLTEVDALEADATTRAEAARAAARLADAARKAGLRPDGAGLPERVSLGDLLGVLAGEPAEGRPDGDAAGAGPNASANASAVSRRGLSAPIGIAADGVVHLDLVADGPHAVVAGTTGAGKSELLVSWVVGMAAGRSPDEVSFVLVDFKGGAAFAPLAGLPHVLGTLSDLDATLARRAIESLRAEVLHRERTLAAAGVRSIDELPAKTLARLVVVVDEFAALVAERSELHALFADLAARGRSLGIHLVLCTQRPAGVVRDAVLANIAVRVALRLADRADSLGLVGDDSAARLPATPRGRAVIVDGAGARRTAQIALAAPRDVERIARATPPSRSRRPWCDPLPAIIHRDALPPADGIPFGLLDLPAEQRQPTAAIEERHGHVLVLGAPGSGTTTALASVAAGAGDAARWLPADPVELWSVLAEPGALPAGAVLLADDLDLTLSRCDPDHALELADLVVRLLRDGPGRRIRLVASARRLAAPIHTMAPLFGSRLILRLGSREEHVLAGADGATFDARARPGAGSWDGAVVQVALPEPAPRVRHEPPSPVVVSLPDRGELAVVAGRPREFAAGWRPDRVRIVTVGEPDAGSPVVDPGRTVLLGDPDAWQGDWAALARARRDLPIVVHGCSAADLRALTRSRETPPPLGPGEVWLVENGRVRRAVLDAGQFAA